MNMKLENTSKLNNKSDIIVRSLTQPTVTDVKIENGTVKMNVQKELGIEVVGDTMVKVSVEEDEDDYEILEQFMLTLLFLFDILYTETRRKENGS